MVTKRCRRCQQIQPLEAFGLEYRTKRPASWCRECFRLTVDHDHATGAIRALLCSHCNTGLGHFSDDIDRLYAAIDYLRRFQMVEQIA